MREESGGDDNDCPAGGGTFVGGSELWQRERAISGAEGGVAGVNKFGVDW